jgi:hypothetical protein
LASLKSRSSTSHIFIPILDFRALFAKRGRAGAWDCLGVEYRNIVYIFTSKVPQNNYKVTRKVNTPDKFSKQKDLQRKIPAYVDYILLSSP